MPFAFIASVQETQAQPAATPAGPPPDTAINKLAHDPVGTISSFTDKAMTYAVEKGPSVLGAMALLVAGWIISGWVRDLVMRACDKAKIELTLARFFGNLARWGILVFTVVTSMGTLGINTTSLAAIVGATGLAIGLALQGNLGNLASGVLLLIFRPFKVGDTISAAGQTGTVESIDLFTTNLDTVDNRRIIIPNGTVFGGVIENQTHHSKRCITLLIPVAHDADLDHADRILTTAADRVSRTVDGAFSDPPPNCVLADITPNVVWNVTVWAKPSKFAVVRQAFLREVKVELAKARLSLPPPAPPAPPKPPTPV